MGSGCVKCTPVEVLSPKAGESSPAFYRRSTTLLEWECKNAFSNYIQGDKSDSSCADASKEDVFAVDADAPPLFGSTLLTTSSAGSSQPRMVRAISKMSQTAISDLTRSGAELSEIAARMEDIRDQLDCRTVKLSQAKAELAQLEMRAKALETTGVDSVYTSELHSGKTMAKMEKKEQLARLESLFGKFDGLFKRIRTEEAMGQQ